jgi:hypothetical protein
MDGSSAGAFDPRVAALIRYKARKLVGQHGFTRDDEEDLRQELALHVVKGLQRHDPARGSERTFADRIVTSKVASIIERARAQKRDRTRERLLSDDVEIVARSAPAVDLLADVRRAVATLPLYLRPVASLLENHTQAEVARRTRLTRQQVRTMRKRIARHFRAHGLSPDHPLRIRPTTRGCAPVHDQQGSLIAAA